MRHSAVVALALSALLGSTAIPAQAQNQPAQQNAAPKPETGTAGGVRGKRRPGEPQDLGHQRSVRPVQRGADRQPG